MIRRPSSWGRPKAPAGQGSIWTRDRSTTPRRSSAAFHSGCSCKAWMTAIDSSIWSAGRTPRHDLPSVDLPAGDRHDGLHHVGLAGPGAGPFSAGGRPPPDPRGLPRARSPWAVRRARRRRSGCPRAARRPARRPGPPRGRHDLVAGQARQGVYGGSGGHPGRCYAAARDGPLPFPSPLEAGEPHAGRPRPCHAQRT